MSRVLNPIMLVLILALFVGGGYLFATRGAGLLASPSLALPTDPIALCAGLPRAEPPPAPAIKNGPLVSFNFDDGFISAYEYGIPIINAAGFPVSMYVITGDLSSPYPGQMSLEQVKALEAAGNEIGAHTRTHPYLTDISQAQALEEICGSRFDLLNAGVHATTFSYPEGSSTPMIEDVVRSAGFLAARNTKAGLDHAATDPFELRSYQVTARSSFSEVRSVIDQAITHKEWLILSFHRIDEEGNAVSVPHQLIQQIVSYVKEQKVPVVTNAQGIALKSRITNAKDSLELLSEASSTPISGP